MLRPYLLGETDLLSRCIACAVLGLLLSSCTMRQIAVNQVVAPLLSEASQEFETETDFELLAAALPGNIKLLEGLVFTEPDSEELNLSLAKAYGAYAFGVLETQYLHVKYGDLDDSEGRLERTLGAYQRALGYGLRWLKLQGVLVSEMQKKIRQSGSSLSDYLNENIDVQDPQQADGVFFLSQSWLGYINLQRNRPLLVSQISLVKGMFDWLCAARPDFRNGVCAIFKGAYLASRPALLGGDPAKARQVFKQAMERWPDSLIIRVAFMEYVLVPSYDADGYQQQATAIQKILTRLAGEQRQLVPGDAMADQVPRQARQQVFQTIAAQRFGVMEQYSAELF